MAKIKDNPNDLLDKEEISKTMLSEKAVKSLELFNKANMLFEKRPNSKEFQEQAEKAGKIASEVIRNEIARIKSEVKNEAEEKEKKEIKKVQSKKIVEKSEKILDDLALCRQKLKEDRQRKIESGEIQPPKKKTLVTKLRQELVRTATLIPKNLKEDTDVIQRTQKAVLNFLNELKGIWGLNKIKPIQDEIKEKFKKLEEKAEAA
jgi:hypothetical protein